jgi:hypothetical protein
VIILLSSLLMDGRKKAAARPAPAAEAKRQPAARAALETPSLADDDDAAAQAKQVDDGQPDVASVDESRGAEVRRTIAATTKTTSRWRGSTRCWPTSEQ